MICQPQADSRHFILATSYSFSNLRTIRSVAKANLGPGRGAPAPNPAAHKTQEKGGKILDKHTGLM
jgi:hypothetical protein